MSAPQRFLKKPVEIDAMQYDPAFSPDPIIEWSSARFIEVTTERLREDDPNEFVKEKVLAIRTLEGDMVISPGDWVIRGVRGEFYPCKPDIFESTYEVVKS